MATGCTRGGHPDVLNWRTMGRVPVKEIRVATESDVNLAEATVGSIPFGTPPKASHAPL